MNLFQPYFRILYNGRNITEDISQYLIEINYTDKITGESDDLNITVEDTDEKWITRWYPEKGARLQLEIGDESGKKIIPPHLVIDEIRISFSRSGNVVNIKAIGAGLNKKSRTKTSYAHENKSLSEIINTIAAKYGYSVVGSIANITIGRVTKKREGDLSFVQRLANEYGYIFSIKGNKMIFTAIKSLDQVPHVISIDRTDCEQIEIVDKSVGIYNAVTVKSYNPNSSKVVQSTYSVSQQPNADKIYFPQLQEADTLEIRSKTESQQQAVAKAESALHTKNSLQQTIRITMPGNCLMVAGNNIEITGMGVLSGIWNILSASHSISRAGYRVELEAKRIIPSSVSGTKQTPKRPPQKPSYSVKEYTNRDNIAFPKLTQ